MSRPWQKFVAPGFEGQPLPISPSPWHSGRWVRLPQEHWELILDFATNLDAACAAKLRSVSWANDDNDMDYIYVSSNELESLLLFLSRLADEIKCAEPLVSDVTDEIADIYPNEEHVCMLQAVAAVFSESIEIDQPFRAWNE